MVRNDKLAVYFEIDGMFKSGSQTSGLQTFQARNFLFGELTEPNDGLRAQRSSWIGILSPSQKSRICNELLPSDLARKDEYEKGDGSMKL